MVSVMIVVLVVVVVLDMAKSCTAASEVFKQLQWPLAKLNQALCFYSLCCTAFCECERLLRDSRSRKVRNGVELEPYLVRVLPRPAK
jgi:hypothetical protein